MQRYGLPLVNKIQVLQSEDRDEPLRVHSFEDSVPRTLCDIFLKLVFGKCDQFPPTHTHMVEEKDSIPSCSMRDSHSFMKYARQTTTLRAVITVVRV